MRPESSRSGSESSNRPATAVRGAGYTSHSSTYDVLSQPSRNMIMSEPNKEERYNIILLFKPVINMYTISYCK